MTARDLRAAAAAMLLVLACPLPRAAAEEAVAPKKDDAPPASLGQALQDDEGITVKTACTNCNNADLAVGGLDNDHVPVICDGFPVPIGLAQIYLLSILPGTVIDRVAVEKGAGDATLEGSAVGGGIRIERARPDPGIRLNASADAGSYGWSGARVDASGKAGWLGGAIASTVATSDAVSATDDENNWLPAFERWTADGRLEIAPSRDHVVRIGGMAYREEQKEGSAGYRGFVSGLPYNRDQIVLTRNQWDVAYDADLGALGDLTVSGFHAERKEDILETILPGDLVNYYPTYFIDDTRDFVEAAWSKAVSDRLVLRGGASLLDGETGVVDVLFNIFNADDLGITFDEALTYRQAETFTETGVFAEGQVSLGEADLVVGLRWADFAYEDSETRSFWLVYDLPDGSKVLPRAALTWKPTEEWTLRYSLGTGYRLPQPAYDEVCCGRRYRGNRGMRMESSRSFGMEATWQPGPEARVSASAFRTEFDDLVMKMMTYASYWTPTYQNINVPEATFSSFNLDGRWDALSWLSLKASIGWLDARNETDGGAVPVLVDIGSPIDATLYFRRIPYRATRNGSIGVECRQRRIGLAASVTAQYTGPMDIQIMDPANNGDLGSLQEAFRTTEDFWTVGINVSQRLRWGLTLVAGVDNLTDYTQPTLGDPTEDFKWGPLRGRYYWAGLSYSFDK